jgi:hypothetical protein
MTTIVEVLKSRKFIESQSANRSILVSTKGTQGPAGTAGVPSIEAVAGEALSANRAVKVINGFAFYADALSLVAQHVAGVTKAAAAQGALIQVQTGDLVTDSGWSWYSGPVFLGAAGGLTQDVSASQRVVVGTAIAPTKVLIKISQPILRA